MSIPTPGYLADVWAPFSAGEQLAGVGAPSPSPVLSGVPMAPVPPPPNASGFPSLAAMPPDPPPTPVIGPPAPPPPLPGPNMSLPTDNPGAMASMPPPNVSQGPPPPPNVGAQPPAPPPSGSPPQGPPMAGPDPNAFPLTPGGGGMSKAMERELRGPSLLGAQEGRNQFSEGTIGRIGERNAHTAQDEYNMALDQERQARDREAAQRQSMIERQDEMVQRQQDFDGTVKQMAQLGHTDRDQWWASRSTPQKIAGFVELALSGFNRAPSMIMKRIDDEVKAQEFAFYAAKDTANAKQTAFSMAMQKYGNADAARAAVAAAGLQVAQAQLAQLGAKWKGTETANNADMALAALQDQKMMQIQNGIQFIPSQYQARRWVDPNTGLIYSEAEAKAMQAKLQEYGHQDRSQAAGVGGQLVVQGAGKEADMEKMLAEQQMSGGLGKAGAAKLAEEAAKAQMERDANLSAINAAKSDLPSIVKGGPVGALAANTLPAFLPGVTEANKNMNAREAYNVRVMLSVAAAYKLSTDATEPKNLAILEKYSKPYLVGANEGEDLARTKMDNLEKLISQSAAAKGPAPVAKPQYPASFTLHGGK